MPKLFIQNRKGQKLSVIVEQPEQPRGLAFVLHGLGGFKEQEHIQAIARAFFENGYTTVNFDAANSIGESDGDMEGACVTNHLEDLEDVIAWAATQPWYREPFVLSGHSLGGMAVLLYAEKFPGKVKALAPISTVVSGALQKSIYKKKVLAQWELAGYVLQESLSKPGIIKKIPWNLMTDAMQYDVLKRAELLTMPVLLVVGERDQSTPVAHQKLLFDALPGQKEFHSIKKSPHTMREPEHVRELYEIVHAWVTRLP